jgi:hypothetical protein
MAGQSRSTRCRVHPRLRHPRGDDEDTVHSVLFLVLDFLFVAAL